MKRDKVRGWVMLVLVAGIASVGWAQANLDAALKSAASYEFGQGREALSVVSDAVRDSQGSPEARKDLETKLLAILKGQATLQGKQFVCHQLSLIGTDASVPVLAGMLTVKDTSDMARYALERIPGEAADKALLGALGKAAEGLKVGIVNSLGVRKCAAAVGAIAPLVTDKDAKLAEAAMAALGKIGGADAVKALAKAKGANKDLRGAWADAYLLCADSLAAAGEDAKALKMYEELAGKDEPDRVRVAAFRGRVLAMKDKGVPLVVEALEGDNAQLQQAATEFVRKLAGAEATSAFAAVLPKAAPPVQVLLLSALADRGDGAAMPAVSTAAKSGDASVRIAALAATGKLGNASCVADLAGVAAKSEKPEKDAARASLDMLRGNDVDAAIVDLMKKSEAPVRAELARSLAARNAVSAVPALLETAKDADETVRVESFKALGALASAKDLPALVDLLVGVAGDNARKEAEKAVVTVSKTLEEAKRAAAVLAAYPSAKEGPAKCSMLTVLGEIGDPSGLSTVFDAAKGGKGDVKEAAIRALSSWPTADALDDVMEIAGKSKDETQRVLALRGALRMLELPGDRGIDATLKYYERAMNLAKTNDEKKMVLGGLANVNHVSALALVEPFLANEDLKKEAGLAAEKIKVAGYKVTASANEGDASRAIDGKMDSRWNSGAFQAPEMFFLIDQGAPYEVTKITLDCSPAAEDYPREYKVYVSNDQNAWGDPVATGKGSPKVTEIACTPKTGQFVKIVQTGSAEKNFWSINELKIESQKAK